ncbi:MAG: hypothetical protein KF814_05090 [Nitrospiraceae bacterium]|nr:hypothetical protein [Nitrospiraceae bacterium]
MSCSRCKGCMIEDFMLDMEESFGPMWTRAWRCMNCGHMHDSILEKNRNAQTASLQQAAAIPPVAQTEGIPLGTEAITRIAA